MPEYQRVRDPETGTTFTIGPVVYDDRLEVLDDEPALDSAGRPLPPTYRVTPDDAVDEDGDVLKGQALTDALIAANLPTHGSADEKRLRLAEHTANPEGVN